MRQRQTHVLLIGLLAAVPAYAESRNLIVNSGFESGVTHWMPLDGWIASSVYDSPLTSRKPDLFKDGLAGSTLPDPLSARVTEEKYEGRYSCRLDRDYEAIHSAYVRIPAGGRHTCSAWLKSTHTETEVRMIVVSAERTGKGYGKAKFQRTEAFRIGTQWQRYWFEAPLVETSDGRYQIIVHLLVRRGGDSEPSTRRIDLRPRSNPEKVYYDQTSWQQMKEADGRPKPWMLAYSAMAYLLESSRPAGQVQLHDRVRCYLFTKPDTTIAVVWGLFTRTHGSGRLVFNPAVHTRVLDIMANPVECRLGPRLAIPVTSTSYYLLFTTADRSAVAAALRRGKVEWQRSD